MLFATFWFQLDQVVYSQDRDCSLGGELEALDLGDRGLEHASLEVVSYLEGHLKMKQFS